jgi:hypothetical protein
MFNFIREGAMVFVVRMGLTRMADEDADRWVRMEHWPLLTRVVTWPVFEIEGNA